MSSCEILQFPLSLMQELLPLAIKYAPYALLFLEAPATDLPAGELANAEKQFRQQLAQLQSHGSEGNPPLTVGLETMLAQGKWQAVIAVDLRQVKNWQQLEVLFSQLQSLSRVRCIFVNGQDGEGQEREREWLRSQLSLAGISLHTHGSLQKLETAARETTITMVWSRWLANQSTTSSSVPVMENESK